jgi:ATP synthase protein I
MTGTDRGKAGREPGEKQPQTGVSGAEFAGAGIQFAVTLVLGAFAGIWSDKKLGTSPWLLIVFVFLGAAAGFYSLYHKLMKGQRLGERRKHAERRDEPK